MRLPAVLCESESFECKKKKIEKFFLRKLERAIRARKREEGSLEKARNWRDEQRRAELLKGYFPTYQKGASSLVVLDWETGEERTLVLDPLKSGQDQLKEAFRRAKKLKTAIAPLTTQVDKIKQEEARLQEQLSLLRKASSLEELAVFEMPPTVKVSPKTEEKKKTPYLEYFSSSGLKIWVGRNGRANEELTFVHAHGNDWWFHATEYAGSHVIIRTSKDQIPDQEAIHDAVQLALYHSKARKSGEGEVVVTQRKYVMRPARGKTGQVLISKHRNVKAHLDLEQIQIIGQRIDPRVSIAKLGD